MKQTYKSNARKKEMALVAKGKKAYYPKKSECSVIRISIFFVSFLIR